MNSDFKDLLRIFAEEEVEYLISAKENATRPQDLSDLDELRRTQA